MERPQWRSTRSAYSSSSPRLTAVAVRLVFRRTSLFDWYTPVCSWKQGPPQIYPDQLHRVPPVHFFCFAIPSITLRSSSPFAPHPFTPSGTVGRNCSYNPSAASASSFGGKLLASFCIAVRTWLRLSPNFLLTGQPPFVRPTALQTLIAHGTTLPRRRTRLCRMYSPMWSVSFCAAWRKTQPNDLPIRGSWKRRSLPVNCRVHGPKK